MTPARLNVLIALFAFGGNGGISSILPEIGVWLAMLYGDLKADPRIGNVGIRKQGDIPLTMSRNQVVKTAMDNGFDVILMIDSDNLPDLYLGHKPWAKPFWQTSFDFLYQRALRGLPSVVCAPYCGPPPHPATGGFENVYVFEVEEHETGAIQNGDPSFRVRGYDRNTAAQMRGIQQIAAGPTGCILYSTDAFRLMPIRQQSQSEIMDDFAAGKLSKERALRLMNMQSWFFYEYTDQFQTQKASTEDVTNTREIQLAGLVKHGQPVVFCNWDAWAGHYKPKCVGMPEPITMEQICPAYIEAVQQGLSRDDALLDVDFTAGLDMTQSPQAAEPEQPPETFQENGQRYEVVKGIPIIQRNVGGRKVYSFGGIETPLRDHEHLTSLVRDLVVRFPEKQLRVVEVGSWVGESAIALQAGFGAAGGSVYCVDTWQGTSSDKTGQVTAELGSNVLFEWFRKNVGDLLGTRIFPVRGNSIDVATSLDPQEADLIFVDADHEYDAVLLDLNAWLPHLGPDGILCGHDYCREFPGVITAVDEFLESYGVTPTLIPGTTLWYVTRAELNQATQDVESPEFATSV